MIRGAHLRVLKLVWLRLAVVCLATLATSIMVGYSVAQGNRSLLLLLLVAPVAALACLFVVRYFQFAVLLLPLTALAVPVDFPTGTGTLLPLCMCLALLLLAVWGASMYNRGWHIAPSPLNKPFLVFCAICVVSLLWGYVWRDPVLNDTPQFIVVQLGQLAVILVSLGSALLIGNFVKTPQQLGYLLGLFVMLCSLMTFTERWSLPLRFLNAGGLWGNWLVAPAYGLLIAQPRLRWYWRACLAVILLFHLELVLLQNSTWLSGWLPAVATIGAITLLQSRRMFVVLLVLLALCNQPVRGFIQTVTDENVAEGSDGRVDLWEQNWQVVKNHWLFGTGPAGYAPYYMTYYRDHALATHNNYLDILAQFGFSGLLAWGWIMVVSLWEGWRLVQRLAPGIIRTAAIVSVGGWAGALVAMMLGDWVLPFAYTQTIGGFKYTVYSWIFLGTLISIRQLAMPTRTPIQNKAHQDAIGIGG